MSTEMEKKNKNIHFHLKDFLQIFNISVMYRCIRSELVFVNNNLKKC